MSRIPGWTKVPSLVLRFVLFAGVAVCAQFAGPAGAAGIHYVKANATGTKTGLSWADAYTDLQAGLAAAEWGDEIWVAQGTYKPTTGTLRTVSFVLKSGVGLYGGFTGGETERDQRDWNANATVLSGDIGTTATTDNSSRVVVGAYLTVLDGFTITGGNSSSGDGGGMYNKDCSPTVTNCTFSGNTAGSGGGMYNTGGSPTVTNCTFSGNTTYRGIGGGMYNGKGTSPTVTNCTFSGNWTSYGDNSAGYGGGGMYNDSGSSPTVTNCTFSGNTASTSRWGVIFGGGMYNKDCSPTVTNCTFSGNTASSDYSSEGGGMCNSGGSATVTNCTFSGNTAEGGGGMYNTGGSPTVANCTFSGNTAEGGGGMYNSDSSATVTNCTFSGNMADSSGGGMSNRSNSPTVTNCTFSGNTASDSGGGIYNWGGSPTVSNCISWDNTAPLGAEVYKESGTPTLSHCDIRGSGGSGALWNPALGADGGGNIMSDPRFVSSATPAGADGLWRTRDDGLRLQSNSPCIGAADPAVAPGTDILGLPRSSPPDIGAYEFFIMPPASADPVWVLFR
jgi:predicted outer membrane repeat protein